MSQVRITSGFSLGEYEWIGPRELEWTFHFWNEPKPRGRLPVPSAKAR